MTKSLIDQAITACQETLETIKQQQEFNKFLVNTHKCPTCGRTFTDRFNADFIDEVGECFICRKDYK
jgi:4-hydroxy-3-methylbut-2-en-1-yl diphosphate synthase IspG/GcpE